MNIYNTYLTTVSFSIVIAIITTLIGSMSVADRKDFVHGLYAMILFVVVGKTLFEAAYTIITPMARAVRIPLDYVSRAVMTMVVTLFNTVFQFPKVYVSSDDPNPVVQDPKDETTNQYPNEENSNQDPKDETTNQYPNEENSNPVNQDPKDETKSVDQDPKDDPSNVKVLRLRKLPALSAPENLNSH